MTYPLTPATKLGRHPERGSYDRQVVLGILDEALICHLGFVADGRPWVIPTMYARLGEDILIHGSPASRMLRSAAREHRVCLTVTLLDGLVMARSAFNHSMNYRSVVITGSAVEVTAEAEKRAAFKALLDHVCPGRWDDARQPSSKELKATRVLRLPLAEVSAKVRSGPPKDDEDDLGRPVWAGELPLRTTPLTPLPDSHTGSGIPVPAYLSRYRRGA